MTTFTLNKWEVSAEEAISYSKLKPGDSVKVLYLGDNGGESNWCTIKETRQNGFLVEPENCLLYQVPEKMEIEFANIKEFLFDLENLFSQVEALV
jgi:hypothetical protein